MFILYFKYIFVVLQISGQQDIAETQFKLALILKASYLYVGDIWLYSIETMKNIGSTRYLLAGSAVECLQLAWRLFCVNLTLGLYHMPGLCVTCVPLHYCDLV